MRAWAKPTTTRVSAPGSFSRKGPTGDSIKKLASLPLLFQPGDAWEYSLSDDVLGYLVERVSGMPFDRFLRGANLQAAGDEAIPTSSCRPTRSPAWPPPIPIIRIKGLQLIPEEKVMKEGDFSYSSDYPYRGPRTYFSGGGGLCSTAEDYYRFCQMMLNNGELNGVRLLEPQVRRIDDPRPRAGEGRGHGLRPRLRRQ